MEIMQGSEWGLSIEDNRNNAGFIVGNNGNNAEFMVGIVQGSWWEKGEKGNNEARRE